ncbi:2-phosphosulfolactate phosphatase [Leifsonia sp. A12D58]|uniref:2-phosphosulfolactate phosphatase n=1 Tax=Leifsonia sp. A12D58 TaxID=3397674 RepID=UPI0039E13CE5
MIDATPQQKYQVRFDWGQGGFQTLADSADVVIIADALPSLATGGLREATDVASATADATPIRVIAATLANRRAVAEWVLTRQTEKGGRFSVAIIAAGDTRADGSFQPSVEDLLAAGAVIDALTDLGIDHCSPDAAAASAAFVGLKQALKHLVSASQSGQALLAAGRADDVTAATALDSSDVVDEIRTVLLPS